MPRQREDCLSERGKTIDLLGHILKSGRWHIGNKHGDGLENSRYLECPTFVSFTFIVSRRDVSYARQRSKASCEVHWKTEFDSNSRLICADVGAWPTVQAARNAPFDTMQVRKGESLSVSKQSKPASLAETDLIQIDVGSFVCLGTRCDWEGPSVRSHVQSCVYCSRVYCSV
jgi:hypothetical protein